MKISVPIAVLNQPRWMFHISVAATAILVAYSCTARGRHAWSQKTTGLGALLCFVSEVMFLKIPEFQ
jgi:hypothetical protein